MTRRSLVRTIRTTSPPSPRLLEAFAALGMGVESTRAVGDQRAARAVVQSALTPNSISLITGPSGSGKSTLLRTIHALLISGGLHCETVDPGASLPRIGCLLDHLGHNAHAAARHLSAAGLADATLWARSPAELSDGERARFAIARAWANLADAPHDTTSGAPAILLIDECASTLDRTTARSACASLAKLARTAPNVSLICATAHADVAQWLAADLEVHCRLAAPARITRNRGLEGGGGHGVESGVESGSGGAP